MFNPPLPAHKQQAIDRLAIGVVDKLFIRFHSAKQQATGSTIALESANGRSVVSQKLLWKVKSTVGNAGFNPTMQPAIDSSSAAEPAAMRSVLSNQLLWKVCTRVGHFLMPPSLCLKGMKGRDGDGGSYKMPERTSLKGLEMHYYSGTFLCSADVLPQK